MPRQRCVVRRVSRGLTADDGRYTNDCSDSKLYATFVYFLRCWTFFVSRFFVLRPRSVRGTRAIRHLWRLELPFVCEAKREPRYLRPVSGNDTVCPKLQFLWPLLWLTYSKEYVASNIDYKHENSKVMRHSPLEPDSRLYGQETWSHSPLSSGRWQSFGWSRNVKIFPTVFGKLTVVWLVKKRKAIHHSPMEADSHSADQETSSHSPQSCEDQRRNHVTQSPEGWQ